DRDERGLFHVEVKDRANLDGLAGVDLDAPTFGDGVVAEGWHSAGPSAAPTSRGHLVPRSLGDHVALELGEEQELFQGHPPQRGAGVKPLADGDEVNAVLLEEREEVQVVPDRSAESIELV